MNQIESVTITIHHGHHSSFSPGLFILEYSQEEQTMTEFLKSVLKAWNNSPDLMKRVEKREFNAAGYLTHSSTWLGGKDLT